MRPSLALVALLASVVVSTPSAGVAQTLDEGAVPPSVPALEGLPPEADADARAAALEARPTDVLLDAVPENASKPLGLLWSTTSEFSPARGETHTFRIAVDERAGVDLVVLGPDGDRVRTLLAGRVLEPGDHDIEWDGRDDDGTLVPDEAYVPRFRATRGGTATLDDPRRYSGGEILPNLAWRRRGATELSYDLPFPARVLVRSGVEDGPMLRELLHWEPVDAGRAVLRWDGRDADGVDRFAERDDVWTVVMAYRLPEFAVITGGNDRLDYRRYRERWPQRVPELSDVPLQRRGERLARDHFLPRGYLPRVSMSFAEPAEPSRFGPPIVSDTLRLRVDVPDEDRWILDASFYETGFYIDYRFQSEEEQGFVPLVWEYDARSLPPGRHLATVQLFGFGGFIASDTVEFLVVE